MERKNRPAWFLEPARCCPVLPSSLNPEKLDEEEEQVDGKKNDDVIVRRHGGWKSMPFIIGNETCERLGTLGLLSNLMVYLLTMFNMKPVYATNVMNVFTGTTNFAPLLGAYLSDAFFGRFNTLAFASIASLLGMATVTLTALLPQLRPPECTQYDDGVAECAGPTNMQLAILFIALALLIVGAGGIKPCNLAFGLDQFDDATEEGRKGMKSFFNWYYFIFTIPMIISLTLVVYIQDSVSWPVGFAIPTLLMLASVILFFLGSKIYIVVKPQGSVFTGLFQVIVASFRKRHVYVVEPVFYFSPSTSQPKTAAPSDGFRFLNKAAMIVSEGELTLQGSPADPWRLCSIKQVDDVKCLIGVFPILISCIICFMAHVQQNTFAILQALKMDRHIGSGDFQIPAGSLAIFTMLALTLWIPIHDRLIVPAVRRITKQEEGITLLQRIGIGFVLAILTLLVSGIVEGRRRHLALMHPNTNGIAPMSVLWLVPQLSLLGLAEAFYLIGQTEFYYKEFPAHMKSISATPLSCAYAVANYLSSLMVTLIRRITGKNGGINWLANDINKGRVDYFYYLIAVMGCFNLLYFFIVSKRYKYKYTTTSIDLEEEGAKTVELSDVKNGC